MRHIRCRSLATPVVAVLAACVFNVGIAAGGDAAYRLQPGDTLEFAVVGMPDLHQQAPVDIDGNVAFPMVGAIKAAGLSLAELRAAVQEQASRSVVRQRTNDGREISIVVNANEVYVTLAQYRPIYVDGDVSKPGEIVFRPGMTVRQAIALAGGYDIARFQYNNPFLQGPDLAADYEVLSNERARNELRIERLEAERAGNPEPPSVFKNAPTSPQLTHLTDLEAEQFRTRVADREKRSATLDVVVGQIEAQIRTLTEQQRDERDGVAADAQEVARIKDLLDKGVSNMLRVTDTRRNLLLSSTRLLQTTSQLERAKRDREDVKREGQHADDTDQLDIISQLQEARLQLATTRARMSATRDKLLYTNLVRSQLLAGSGAKPRLVVIRKGAKGTDKFVASEDTPLRPSDVVEAELMGSVPGTLSAVPDTSADQQN